MTLQVLCDACGEPIDQQKAYFQVVATKVKVPAKDDPTLPDSTTVVQVSRQFDYHDGHQPDSSTPRPPPEPGEYGLTSLEPASVAKGSTDTLHVLGNDFTNTAKVILNDVPITTTFVSETELTCEPNTSSLSKRDYNVLVRQDGADTNPLPLTIT